MGAPDQAETFWTDRRKKIGAFFLIFFLFLLPRLILIYIYRLSPASLNDDGFNEYWIFSEDFIRYGLAGFGRDPYMEPVYPMVIAFARLFVCDDPSGVFLVQAVLSSIGCVYFYYLVKKLTESRMTAFIAVLLFMFYPYYLRTAVKISEVPLFRTLLVISAYYFIGAGERVRNAALAGFFLGVTFMCRSMIFPAVILAAASQFMTRRFRQGLIVAGVFLITCSPMLLVYGIKHGTPLPLRGGINLYLSNNQFYGRLFPTYHMDSLEGYAHSQLAAEMPGIEPDRKTADQFFYKKAWEFIAERPDKFVRNKFRNMLLFFDPWVIPRYPLGRFSIEPDPEGNLTIRQMGEANVPLRYAAAEILHAIFRIIILVFASIGIWMRRRFLLKSDLILIIYFATFWAVYTMFWPSTRLYAPVMFVFMFYAAVALRFIVAGKRPGPFSPVTGHPENFNLHTRL